RGATGGLPAPRRRAASAATGSIRAEGPRCAGPLLFVPCRSQEAATMPAHAPRNSCLSAGDREARADGERGALIDRVAAGPPAGKLLFVEALAHMRVPFGA